MISRMVAETYTVVYDEPQQRWRLVSDGLAGAFSAGVVDGFSAVPAPRVSNPRVRFYFTALGWEQFGDAVIAAARAEGRAVRVIRRKNPPRSQILYQDAYQVAILPPARALAAQHGRKRR